MHSYAASRLKNRGVDSSALVEYEFIQNLKGEGSSSTHPLSSSLGLIITNASDGRT